MKFGRIPMGTGKWRFAWFPTYIVPEKVTVWLEWYKAERRYCKANGDHWYPVKAVY